jgi:hypothetical protein
MGQPFDQPRRVSKHFIPAYRFLIVWLTRRQIRLHPVPSKYLLPSGRCSLRAMSKRDGGSSKQLLPLQPWLLWQAFCRRNMPPMPRGVVCGHTSFNHLHQLRGRHVLSSHFFIDLLWCALLRGDVRADWGYIGIGSNLLIVHCGQVRSRKSVDYLHQLRGWQVLSSGVTHREPPRGVAHLLIGLWQPRNRYGL